MSSGRKVSGQFRGVSGPVSVRALERGLDLLSALEKADGPLGLKELSSATCIPKTTVHRLLAVLESRQLVQKDRDRYKLGNGLVSLASAFLAADSLVQVALPILQELAQASEGTASLFVRQGFDRVIVQRASSPHSLRFWVRIGQRFPLYQGASGQVLTAAMPEAELHEYLQRFSEFPLATGEVLSRAELLDKLQRVRLQGYGVSHGEQESGIVSVAAPVVKSGGHVVAAIAVTGPPSRMTPEKVQHLCIELPRAGRLIGESCS